MSAVSAQSLYRKVRTREFHKTDFALALLAHDPAAWTVPSYISEGLKWLEDQVAPPPPAVAAPQAGNAECCSMTRRIGTA